MPYYPGRTHRFFMGKTLFPFGFGLSYTTWEYTWASSPAPVQQTAATPATTFTVKVTNTGTRSSDRIVLVMATPPNAGVDGVPLQVLVAFQRIHVPSGESVETSFSVESAKLHLTNTQGVPQYSPGKWVFSVDSGELTGHVTLA